MKKATMHKAFAFVPKSMHFASLSHVIDSEVVNVSYATLTVRKLIIHTLKLTASKLSAK